MLSVIITLWPEQLTATLLIAATVQSRPDIAHAVHLVDTAERLSICCHSQRQKRRCNDSPHHRLQLSVVHVIG